MKNPSVFRSPHTVQRDTPNHLGVHVGVQIEGGTPRNIKLAAVIDILRDTKGQPIWDTGYGVLTAPTLQSGIKMNSGKKI